MLLPKIHPMICQPDPATALSKYHAAPPFSAATSRAVKSEAGISTLAPERKQIRSKTGSPFTFATGSQPEIFSSVGAAMLLLLRQVDIDCLLTPAARATALAECPPSAAAIASLLMLTGT